jgi:hypothetical protein
MSTYSFLFEHTTTVSSKDFEILNESKTPYGGKKFIVKTRLQEAGVKNANKRVYDNVVCENIVAQLSPKAKSRSLLMEIDHPVFFDGATDPNLLKKRAATIEINNCGALIRNIGFKNGQIIGELETLSGFKGPDLAGIIQDGVDIGFSLRALGGITPMGDGTLKVKTPILPITYDIVSNPSHQNSRIVEFLPENDLGILEKAESVIFENTDFELIQDDDLNIGDGLINNYARKFVDELISEHFMKVVSKRIQFKI